ncbi:hypothetical protein [Jatrophihabitans sp.]|uniref:hypothetical protein n=1 Tax=Jatrophihabitans sp. TaxID=1932789 RepID=UPI0030C6FBB9
MEHQAPSIASLARRALRPTSPAETDLAETDPAETDPAETDPAETDPADSDLAAAAPTAVAPHSDGSRLVTALLSGLVALALVFAAISGVVWWRAGHGGSSREAKARDAVLLQVHLDLATLNTLDYRAVDAGLARWAAVTTGSLHAGIVDASAATKSVITKARTVTKAVVLDAAVTSLNLQKGSATVIASIQVTKTPDTGSAVVDRNRVSATMSLVHGIWRVSDLQGVLVQLS